MSTNLEALRRGDLAGATELRLNAGLTEFPREIFGLADTLEVLDLSANQLDRLPEDMGRLRKLRILFCSGNRFDQLPPALGDCPALSQVGFRRSGLRAIPGEALPPALRWLTVTDNRLTALPGAIGRRPLLQKLMLSGNSLTKLPTTLQDAPNLELLRLSANRFEALPPWLADLPRLAWLAWAGNPLDSTLDAPDCAKVDWNELSLGPLLGEGASGRVYDVRWQTGGAQRRVALKLFKDAVTSDGLPASEIAACLTAGDHQNLLGALGQLSGHPDQAQGMLMPLLPVGWRVLAGPPSLASCSRDVYDAAVRFNRSTALRVATSIAAAAAHLHGRGVLHGDLYAHNTLWDGEAGNAVLSDFGGASFLPAGSAGIGLQRTEVLAWGILLGELLDRCDDLACHDPLRQLEAQCTASAPAWRPSMAEIQALLGGAG
jgi:hypothetical protein